jgi:hypothetical protein
MKRRDRRRRRREHRNARKHIARVMRDLTPQSLRYLAEVARGLREEQSR